MITLLVQKLYRIYFVTHTERQMFHSSGFNSAGSLLAEPNCYSKEFDLGVQYLCNWELNWITNYNWLTTLWNFVVPVTQRHNTKEAIRKYFTWKCSSGPTWLVLMKHLLIQEIPTHQGCTAWVFQIIWQMNLKAKLTDKIKKQMLRAHSLMWSKSLVLP